jgi:hypothetical protein
MLELIAGNGARTILDDPPSGVRYMAWTSYRRILTSR